MNVTDDEKRLLDEKIAAFDTAAKWHIAEGLSRLDDTILDEAVSKLTLPEPDKSTGSDYTVIPVPQKMKLNFLKEDSQDIIRKAMCVSRAIGTYIRNRCRTEHDFGIRLRTYFCNLYYELRKPPYGYLGDCLFKAMVARITQKVPLVNGPAATAILVHLFLICDVFEKSGETFEHQDEPEEMR